MPRNKAPKTARGQQPGPKGAEDSSLVARGTGMALLGRVGALVEVVSFVLFAKLYGQVYFGLFFSLWSYVNAATIISDCGMTSALQRFIPLQDTRVGMARVLRHAISISLPLSLIFALTLYALAPAAAQVLQNEELPAATLTAIIRLYLWTIPLWTFINVTTAAVSAQRIFGPDIKVRIFYEQTLRLVSGVVFFYAGMKAYGIFAAHLASLAITVILSIRLIARYYKLSDMFKRADDRDTIRPRGMIRFGVLMVLPNLNKKLHAFMPVYFMNFMIPGTAGVTIVGVYALARKIVSVLQVIRDSFEYVLAPIAAKKKSTAAYESLSDIYAFSTRFICASFIPAATLIVAFHNDLLGYVGPEYLVGSTALMILVIGRLAEAATGPSSAIISMIGRYRLPLLNAVASILSTATALYFLVPNFGINGAAAAAAMGINVTSLTALVQVHAFHGLRAFNRRLLRPVAVSGLASAAMVAIILLSADLGIIVKAMVGIAGFVATWVVLLRYAFDARDLAAIFPRQPSPFMARIIGRRRAHQG